MRNKEVYAYAWNNVWEWGGGKHAYTLANAGYKVNFGIVLFRIVT